VKFFGTLWLIHALVGAALAAPVLFLGRKRVGWAGWQWLTLVIPFFLWTLLMISPFTSGRGSLLCIGEPILISLALPILAIVRIRIGRSRSERLQSASFLAVLCGIVVTAFFAVPLWGVSAGLGLTKFDRRIIDAHGQRYPMSCIPSSVEMVLKLTGRVPQSYYGLQNSWKNKADGSFHDFDGKTIAGVTFRQQFCMARNSAFPLAQLFDTIDHELKAGRFVIVGLASGHDFHNWVIYDEGTDGEFLAASKAGPWTIQENHVKKVITLMQGTDIGTYDSKP